MVCLSWFLWFRFCALLEYSDNAEFRSAYFMRFSTTSVRWSAIYKCYYQLCAIIFYRMEVVSNRLGFMCCGIFSKGGVFNLINLLVLVGCRLLMAFYVFKTQPREKTKRVVRLPLNHDYAIEDLLEFHLNILESNILNPYFSEQSTDRIK